MRVFRIITPESETEHWATNDEQMHELARLRYVEDARGIEAYHRALKQGCRAEQAMVRSGQAQCNHPLASGYPGMAIRAGCPLGRMRLQWHRVRTGIGLGMAKEGIIRRAVRFSLTRPWYTLPATA